MERSASSSQPPSTDIDLSWRMRDREAQALARLVRSSRLTLLHAEPGVGRTELLAGGVLPLLRRRASDAVGEEDRESRVVIPFSDRRMRRAGRSSTRIAERPVLFDGWGPHPTAALRTAVLASLPADAATYARSTRLAPMMGELSRRFDAHFLVILDSFERFWHPAMTLEEGEAFVDEFSEAVNQKGLRAHFLLSIDDPTDPRLEALRQRIDVFGESALNLLRWDSDVVAATKTAEAAAPAPVRQQDASSPFPVLSVPVLNESIPRPLSAAVPAPISRITPAPARTSAAEGGAVAAPKTRPRRPKPPRLPVVKPEPIRTEGVYAFIESTLTQTASDFAPWQDGEDEAGPAPSEAAAPSPLLPLSPLSAPPSPETPKQPPSAATPAEGGGSQRPAAPDSLTPPARLPPPEVKPSGPIDKWLRPVVAWSRRLGRKP